MGSSRMVPTETFSTMQRSSAADHATAPLRKVAAAAGPAAVLRGRPRRPICRGGSAEIDYLHAAKRPRVCLQDITNTPCKALATAAAPEPKETARALAVAGLSVAAEDAAASEVATIASCCMSSAREMPCPTRRASGASNQEAHRRQFMRPPAVVAAKEKRRRGEPSQLSVASLRKIYAAMQRLSPEARRTAMTKLLTESQRLQLEQFILRCPSLRRSKTSTLSNDAKPSPNPAAEKSSQVKAVPERRLQQKLRSGVWGIKARKTRSGGLTYSASMAAGPFVMFTKSVPGIAEAERFHEALKSVSDSMARVSSLEDDATTVMDAFRRALREDLGASGLSLKDLGLTFCGMVFAKHWIGKALNTPRFDVECSLEAGLAAWRQLFEARGLVFRGKSNRHTSMVHRHCEDDINAAWQSLREAYVKVWSSRGFSREDLLHKLNALEERHKGQAKAAANSVRSMHCSSTADSEMPGPSNAMSS